MCTAATYKTKDFYFGRTLDYEFSYGDEVVITPRNFPFNFREKGTVSSHYAMIGMAHVADNCPLYYEVVNEKGLCMAGLNFVGNAVYFDPKEGKDNIAQFEFIAWILCQCADVKEARAMLQKINITKEPFSDKLPVGQLHWIIADKEEAVTVESVVEGLKVYDNPVGVLTNNPPFLANTQEIVDKIEAFDLEHAPLMPHFPLPEPFTSDMEYLRHLTYEGAKKRYGENFRDNDTLRERIDFELSTIEGMGFPGYFLIVWDFIRAAREMGVLVGPGRGSAAGSALAYCLGITNIDPIKYDLLFELMRILTNGMIPSGGF